MSFRKYFKTRLRWVQFRELFQPVFPDLWSLILHLINFTAQIVKSTCSFHDIFRNSFSLLPANCGLLPFLPVRSINSIVARRASIPAGWFGVSLLRYFLVVFRLFNVHPFALPHRPVSQSSLPAPCEFQNADITTFPDSKQLIKLLRYCSCQWDVFTPC